MIWDHSDYTIEYYIHVVLFLLYKIVLKIKSVEEMQCFHEFASMWRVNANYKNNFFPDIFRAVFKRVCETFLRGFQSVSTIPSVSMHFKRVSTEFQSVSKGFPKGFKAFQKGFRPFRKDFQRVSKHFKRVSKGFQSISKEFQKRFQRVSNPQKPGFQRVSEWPQTPWKTLLWMRRVFVWRVTYMHIILTSGSANLWVNPTTKTKFFCTTLKTGQNVHMWTMIDTVKHFKSNEPKGSWIRVINGKFVCNQEFSYSSWMRC